MQSSQSRKNAGKRGKSATSFSGSVPPSKRSWRRWTLLVVAAFFAAVALVFTIVPLLPQNSERSSLRNAIHRLASTASPDIVPLLLEAGEVGDRMLRDFPQDGGALNVVAQLYERLGYKTDAIRCWKRCIELAPESAASYHASIGTVAYDEGDFETAACSFRTAVEQDPASTAYPVQFAEALIGQGQLRKAVTILENNLKARPRSMPTCVLLGQTYLQLGQYGQARQRLEMALKMGAVSTNSYYTLATICTRLGDHEKARDYTEKFKKLQADKEQRHRHALKTRNDVRDSRETVANTYIGAAEVYAGHGDIQTGERYLLRAAELVPRGPESRVALAWLYEQQGRTREALQALAQAGELASGNLSAQMNIAAAYTRLDRFDDAENAYRQVIELTPNQATGYAALASLYIQADRNLPEARSLAEKATELTPVAEYYLLLSVVCRKNGDLAGATAAAKRAVELEPREPDMACPL